jgi:hypothetical protein
MNNSAHTPICRCGKCCDIRKAAAVKAAKELPKTGCVQGACSASLAQDTAKATDVILSQAITAMVGEGWMIADLRGRLQSVRVRDEPQETILLDGKPLVELWPVELEAVNEGGKITITAKRRYRTFRPQNGALPRPSPAGEAPRSEGPEVPRNDKAHPTAAGK